MTVVGQGERGAVAFHPSSLTFAVRLGEWSNSTEAATASAKGRRDKARRLMRAGPHTCSLYDSTTYGSERDAVFKGHVGTLHYYLDPR